MKYPLMISLITACLLSTSASVQAGSDGTIYGSQFMTQQERLEYRKKILNAKTAEERQQIREEHHAMMQERARTQGKSLPETPPAEGDMMHKGGGMGSGGGMGGR